EAETTRPADRSGDDQSVGDRTGAGAWTRDDADSHGPRKCRGGARESRPARHERRSPARRGAGGFGAALENSRAGAGCSAFGEGKIRGGPARSVALRPLVPAAMARAV